MPKEILQRELSGYESEFFHTNANNSGVVFHCPVNGATTKNSTNPRSELRQMINGGKDQASWSNKKQQWQMDCTLQFNHMPGDCDVVGMQIHDDLDDTTVLRRIGSELYITKGDDFDYKRIATGITDATILNMSVVAVKGGGFQWFRDGVHVGGRGGTKSGCYFKAGCYVQLGDNPSGFGEVTIYGLRVQRTL